MLTPPLAESPAIRADSHASKSPSRPAIDALTSLRGLAAVWVVLFHFQNDLLLLLPSLRIVQPVFRQGHFAVPIFFTLSGYVLTYNYLDLLGVNPSRSELLRFWARRLARIYPLHLATLLVVLAMVLVASRSRLSISATGYSLRDFVLNLLLLQTWVTHYDLNWNYPSWSISSEWFAYLFFPLACLVLCRLHHRAVLIGLALLLFVFSIGWKLYHDELPFGALVVVVGPFLLGCIWARLHNLGSGVRGAREVAWGLLLALGLIPYLTSPIARAIGLTAAGSALVFVLGSVPEGRSRFWTWRPLVLLGEVSYSLYMVHAVVQKLVNQVIPSARFASHSLAVRLAVVLCYVAAIALATWVAHRLVDDPARRWLRRRFSL